MDGEGPRFSVVIHPAGEPQDYIPLAPELLANYPNPFNPSTTIRFAVPEQQQVRIDMYDVLGRRVHTLVNESFRPGTHELAWNASNLASGVYVVRLVSGEHVLTRTMTLLK